MWNFDTDGNAMGWTNSGFVAGSVVVQDGVWKGKTSNTSSRISLDPIPPQIEFTNKDYIEIKLRQRIDNNFGIFGITQGFFRYKTTTSNVWNNIQTIGFQTYGSNSWYVHKIYIGDIIDLNANPQVKPTAFRFNFNNLANVFVEVDYIRLMRDETPPDFVLQNIQSFRNGQVISNNTPSMKIMKHYDNALGIDRVEFYYRPGASESDDDWILDGVTTDPSFGYRHTYSPLADGVYDFAVQVIDKVGNRHSFTADENKWINDVVIDSNAQTVVRVKPDQITNPIRKNIPSHNILWSQWTNLYNPSTNSTTTAIDNRVNQLKIPILRYPGGCHSDTFYWKLSIGPVQNRPNQFANPCNPNISNYGPAKFGLDEFVRYCKARNIEPMITIRFRYNKPQGDTTPDCSLDGRDGLTPFQEALEDAADLVEYLNAPNDGSNPNGGVDWAEVRAQNGHPEPYNVKYFEIGNEPWGPDPFGSPRPDGEYGIKAAEIYALHYIMFYNAMKAVDPNIYVSAAGNIGAQPGIADDNKMWDPIVYAIAGQYMDALHTHPYKPFTAYWVSNDDRRYWQTLVSPYRMDDDIDNQRRYIRDWSGDRLGDLRVWFNEWNVNYGWRWKGAIYEGDSLMAALALAGFFNVMAENYDVVDSSNWWHMYGERPYALFVSNGNITSPLFHVFRMFANHYQDFKVVSYVDGSPTIDFIGISFDPYFPEMKGIPIIGTSATISEDGKKLSLTIVNKDKYQNRTVGIDLGNFVPDNVNVNASVYKLTGSNPQNAKCLLDYWIDDESIWEITKSDASITESSETFQRYFTYELPKHSVISFLFEKAPKEMDSISSIKLQEDKAYVSISDVVVSAVFDGFIYVQDQNRTAGIRVKTDNNNFEVGDIVRVVGEVDRSEPEIAIAAESITLISKNFSVKPMGMNNKTVGGGSTDGGQAGVWSWEVVEDENNPENFIDVWMCADGLNNIGLLVKTWGKVTHIGDGYMYIDDGSDLNDDPANCQNPTRGIKVICDASGFQAGVDFVAITGISSCYERDGYLVRQIITRLNSDVQKIASDK
ncbi:MAG: alpha-L-arabinofuranosidase C-terminal domain-containing protein [Armatimonadota bacterium]